MSISIINYQCNFLQIQPCCILELQLFIFVLQVVFKGVKISQSFSLRNKKSKPRPFYAHWSKTIFLVLKVQNHRKINTKTLRIFPVLRKIKDNFWSIKFNFDSVCDPTLGTIEFKAVKIKIIATGRRRKKKLLKKNLF